MMASSKKRMLEEILPVRIIREVEKWPVLYMRDCPEMPNMHFKKKVWNEVAKALIEDWDSYSPTEKKCKILELTKKWRNLRDAFNRDVLVDKRRRQGHNVRKKKYVYFKHMSFLLPHLAGAAEAEPAPTPRRHRTADHALNHIDEDRHFLMSLLPSFKRMSVDEKLSAKMDILKVIKEVRKQSTATAAMATYASQLDLGGEQQLNVKSELFIDEPDFKSVSECSGLSPDGCGDSD